MFFISFGFQDIYTCTTEKYECIRNVTLRQTTCRVNVTVSTEQVTKFAGRTFFVVGHEDTIFKHEDIHHRWTRWNPQLLDIRAFLFAGYEDIHYCWTILTSQLLDIPLCQRWGHSLLLDKIKFTIVGHKCIPLCHIWRHSLLLDKRKSVSHDLIKGFIEQITNIMYMSDHALTLHLNDLLD